jgi:hypothetical protein
MGEKRVEDGLSSCLCESLQKINCSASWEIESEALSTIDEKGRERQYTCIAVKEKQYSKSCNGWANVHGES